MPDKPSAREMLSKLQTKLDNGRPITVSDVQMVGLEEIEERWENRSRNQVVAINRLLAIIQRVRETVYAETLTPDDKVHNLKEALSEREIYSSDQDHQGGGHPRG